MTTKYKTVIADPPWEYNNRQSGAAANHYRTMTPEEITALPVQSLVSENAILLLWATWPQIEIALDVMSAWGFDYVTGFPWIKITEIQPTLFGEIGFVPQYGMGYWARGVTEIVLIGRRGSVAAPNTDFIGLLSPNAHHSRKPDSLYEYAESLPGPYLELFARRPRDGWDVFGNEVPGSIELPDGL